MRGSAWLMTRGIEASAIGRTVADLLGLVYAERGGIEDIAQDLKDTDWTRADCIEAHLRDFMATHDNDRLTRLVLLAHALCMRCELQPRSANSIRLVFRPSSTFRYPSFRVSLAVAAQHELSRLQQLERQVEDGADG